jgi:DNA-binding beta-propeller fold protein YncE
VKHRIAIATLLTCLLCATSDWAASSADRAADAGTAGKVAEPIVWPKPPAEARIRYERSIGSGADWGIARSAFGRFVDRFTGRRESHLVRPTGVAESGGVLYVADPGAQTLFIFDATKNRVVEVNRFGNETLVSPVSVALGKPDTVYLVDSWRKKVYQVGRDGKLQRTVVEQGLSRPAGVVFDATRERLYVADSVAHTVLVFAPDGRQLQTIGSNGQQDGQFNSPTHLALERDGSLLVTDALNFRVQVFDPEGRFARSIGAPGDGAGNFSAPKGVATDLSGNVYVADAMFDAVQVFDPGGQLLLGFGRQGTRPGEFWLPNGLFIDDHEMLYVADAYNQRVQVFQMLPATAARTGRQ